MRPFERNPSERILNPASSGARFLHFGSRTLAIVALAFLFWVSFAPTRAAANVGETYGFGSRTAALAGAGVAWGAEGFAAYTNPGALSLPSENRLTVSWGLLLMQPKFTPIDGVVIENNYVSDKVPARTGSVDVDYRSTFGQSIGLTYVAAPEWHRLSLGFTAFLPINQFAYFDSGEAYQPEYFMHRARTQRPQFEFGAGAELVPGFHAGFGLHVGYGLTSNGSVFLRSNASKPSSLRLGASLKPKVAPFFGLLGRIGEDVTTGLVFRFPLRTTNEVRFRSAFQLPGDLAGLDIGFVGAGALYYDPMTLEIGGSWKYASKSRLILQADYQAWRLYRSPALSIEDPRTQDCTGTACTGGVNISPGNNPRFSFRDIVIPRIAHELELESVTLRAGWAYKPSVIREVPTGPGNYLDPPRHRFSVGAGFQFAKFLHFDVPCRLDLHGSYQPLTSQKVTKTPGNEGGDLSDSKIGAPGYEAGGKIYGGGISLSLAL